MRSSLWILLFGLVASCFATTTFAAKETDSALPSDSVKSVSGTHTLNLKDADIQALIATVSEITGKNFILGPGVQGKVTVVSAKPMKPDEIYDVFLSVLRVHGFAAVAAGSMIKIVPETMAQQDGSAGLNGQHPHPPDELVTQIVPVKHIAASELLTILRPLAPQGAQLMAHGSSNSLIISDRAGNVQRLISIIQRIDTVSDAEIEVIPLRHASAAELSRTLTQLNDVKATDASGEQAKVFADERTNSILLSGGKSGRLKLRALITHLDTPLESGGDTQVVYLRYASAKDLVPILQGVAATLNNESPPIKASGDTGNAVSSAVGSSTATIQAHDETNALIISASPAVFRSLSAVIRNLDIRRAQVLIEAVIAEVSDEAATEIGVQWQAPLKTDANGNLRAGAIGGTNFTGKDPGSNILSTMKNPLGVGQGLNLGYINGSVKLPGSETTIFEVGALIRALKGDSKSNILSTPSVLTLDNQEAIIKVAQEVPFITGQYTNTSTSGGTNQPSNPFQTIQRKDVGLTLKVTPHINEGDAIRLNIHQEVSSLAQTPAGAVDLVTNKRELQTQVLVSDDTVLVLGGLISNDVQNSVQKVPGLSKIPLLGNLFRSRNASRSKRNLMIFLHPRILRDAATEESVSSEKYNFIRTEQLQMRENRESLTPKNQQPLLPENLNSPALPSDNSPTKQQSVPTKPKVTLPNASLDSVAALATPVRESPPPAKVVLTTDRPSSAPKKPATNTSSTPKAAVKTAGTKSKTPAETGKKKPVAKAAPKSKPKPTAQPVVSTAVAETKPTQVQ